MSSKDHLEKYEYLTVEDLGHKPSVFEKVKFEYSPLGMSLNRTFKKDEVKSAARSKRDFNYDGKNTFYRWYDFTFYKGYDEFKEMSLDSKYNKMNKLTNLLTKF